jgi:formylglycine-generating enzyme required for sulfatase activity
MKSIWSSSYLTACSCGAVSLLASCQHAVPRNQGATTKQLHQTTTESKDFTQQIAGTTLSIQMIAVTTGNQDASQTMPAFWIQAKEVTWDLYDTFVYELDEPGNPAEADGMTRPSKPYVTFDRGWGHAGYPALSMSAKNAEAFCAWLSIKTDRHYQIPTQAQWTRACELSLIAEETLQSHAWFKSNANGTTHPVGEKLKSQLGTYDMWGNVAEWVTTSNGPALMGGSYRDVENPIGCAVVQVPVPDWNDSDPQIPKSQWWLADAPFAGLRVVCVD